MDNEEAKRLINLIAAGDEAAFTAMHKAYSRTVYAFVLNHLNSPADAEEVMVDTLCEVWQGAGRFKGDSLVRTWVLGIARNKLLMKLRERRPHQDIDDLPEHEEYELVKDMPDATELIALTEEQQGVRLCMRKLTATHRDCLQLFYFEGCSVREVSTLQGVDEKTVKGRLFQARQKIRPCIEALCRAMGSTG